MMMVAGCRVEMVTPDGIPCVFIVAIAHIPKDTEVLVDYGSEFLRHIR